LQRNEFHSEVECAFTKISEVFLVAKNLLFLQSDFLHFDAFKKQTLQNYQKCEEFVK